MAIITQKDIIDVVRANIEIMEEIIETIDGTSYLKDKKKYDDKAISEHVKFLYGDPDKQKSSGKPSGLISELVVANDCLAKLAKVKVVNSKKIKKNATSIINSINDVIEAVNQNMPADVKDIDQVTKNITNVKKIVDALISVSKDIFILALISPLLIIASLLAIVSVLIIMAFVWVVVTLMNMIKATVSKEQLESFERVRALCRCLIIIDLEIITLALLTPAVTVAAVIALLGLGILTLCVWGMTFMLNFMVKLIKKVYDELAIVSMFFIVLILTLVGISLGLLVVALIATIVVQLIPKVLIFLGMLIGIIIMLTVIGFILGKMTGVLIDAMIGLILLTVIMALTTAVAAMLLIVVACSIFIVEHIGELFAFFGVLIGVVVMMMVLGIILMIAIIPLAFCIAGLALLAVVVTELIVVATELVILQLFNLDEKKLDKNISAITSSVYNIGLRLLPLAMPWLLAVFGWLLVNVGLLLGVMVEIVAIGKKIQELTNLTIDEKKVINNVTTIFNILDLIFERLGDKKKANMRKKIARKAKKMFKHIRTALKYVSDIVNDFMKPIMDLELKEKPIIKKVDVIFNTLDYIFESLGDEKAIKMRKKLAKQAKRMMKRVGRVMDIVEKMVETLNSLQEIKLKQRKIQNNLDLVWETIESIETQIKKKTDENGGGLKGLFNRWKKARQQKNFTKELGRIGKIVEILSQMCDALNGIQDIKLKNRKITDNLNTIFEVIDNIESQIKSKIPEDQGLFKGLFTNWKKKTKDQQFIEQLGRIGKIVEIVGTMCTTLNSLQQIKLNKKDIKSGLDAVWAAVEDIEAQIKVKTALKEEEKGFFQWFRMWGREKEEAQQQVEFEQYMGNIGKICASITTAVDLINKLSEIKIDRTTITNNLAEVFGTIDFLEGEIKKYTSSIDWGKVGERVNSDWVGTYRGSMETRIETMEQARDLLGPAAEVITSISTTMEAMNSLQNLKLSKKKIKNSIEGLFNFLDDELVPIIAGSMENKGEDFYASAIKAIEDRKEMFDALDLIQPYFEQLTSIANFKISKSGLIEELTYMMCDLPLALHEKLSIITESQLETVNDQMMEIRLMIKDLVKINEYIEPIRKIGEANLDAKTIGKNIGIVFYDIPNILSKAVDEFKMSKDKSGKMGLLIGSIEDIQDVLKDFNVSNTQVENQKKMTENYIKFLDKIDNVDNSNLKTTVSLFEQMARLSESISGNFDGLAQAINDKIAPLLEELNKLLEEVPEKIKEKTGGESTVVTESESEGKSEKKNNNDMKNMEKGIDEVVAKLSKLIRVTTDIKDEVIS